MNKRKIGITVILSIGIITLNVLYNNAGKMNAFDRLTRDQLPAGVPSTSKNESACFAPGEKEALAKWVTSPSNTVSFELCANQPFIAPVQTIRGNKYYTSGSFGSTFDCRQYRKNYAHTENVRLAYNQIGTYADEMLNSPKQADRIRGAKCLARIYLHWAQQDGLGKLEYSGDLQPDYIQLWSTSAISSTYARYKKQIDEYTKKFTTTKGQVYATIINKWFEKMGGRILAQIEREEKRYSTKDKYKEMQNNMSYWRGYALLSTAVHTQNLNHLKKSEEIFKIGLSHVTGGTLASDKGYLPLELARGSRALSYHQFSLQALAGMANLSAAMRCDFLKTDQNLWKMALLMRKTTEGNRDSRIFRDAAFCHLNGNCERATTVKRPALEQSAGGSGEPFFPLITNSTHKEIIRQRITSYLRTKNITFIDRTGKSNFVRNLGGDIKYAPQYGSIRPSKKDIKSYCGIQ